MFSFLQAGKEKWRTLLRNSIFFLNYESLCTSVDPFKRVPLGEHKNLLWAKTTWWPWTPLAILHGEMAQKESELMKKSEQMVLQSRWLTFKISQTFKNFIKAKWKCSMALWNLIEDALEWEQPANYGFRSLFSGFQWLSEFTPKKTRACLLVPHPGTFKLMFITPLDHRRLILFMLW